MDKSLTGARGEVFAARYLRDSGFQIFAANVSNRYGEVDIIAGDEEYIFFVEVKTRTEGALATPAEAVSLQKQKKICGVAAAYLQKHRPALQPRFDVIEVYLKADGSLDKINHIKNAFESLM